MRIHSRHIPHFRLARASVLTVALALFAGQGSAQTGNGPTYVAPTPTVAPPVDHPFAGVMRVDVDATDVARRIFTVHQQIPVDGSGAVTLLYPRWEAASHGPSLTVTDLAGLEVSAAGRRLPWRRDGYEPHAFHVEVPAGTQQIEVRFQMLAGGELLTRDIVSVPWQRLLLYPAGWYARNIPVAAMVTLPGGLRPFSALDVERAGGTHYAFKTTSLETLLDAPVLAGRYAAQLPLTGAVSLDIVAQRPADLQVPPARVAELRSLLAQLGAVFGPPPFARYAILARLSDEGSAGGAEHRASSENGLASSHFQDWPGQILSRDLIAHAVS